MTQPNHETTAHSPKVYYSWRYVEETTHQLADMVTADCKQKGEGYDNIVFLPRGGLQVANLLSRLWNFGANELLSLSLTTYQTGSTIGSEYRKGQSPLAEEVHGKKLIVVDEVCDTGRSLVYAINYLEQLGACEVDTAVLDYKPARTSTGYVPTFWVNETDKWIVYPWEPAEGLGLGNRSVNQRFVLQDAVTLEEIN